MQQRIMLGCCCVMLFGCNDSKLDQLQITLDEIRHSSEEIVPITATLLPETPPRHNRNGKARNPFLVTDGRQEIKSSRQAASLFVPGLPHSPVFHEHFPLLSLQLAGTLTMGDQRVALVASPDGQVLTVQEGDYLGSHYGQITHISLKEVTVTEHVHSQQQGWQERQILLSTEGSL